MSDWSITITDNNSNTHQPALYAPPGEDLPRRVPKANGRPTLEFGVKPKRDSNGDPKWFDSKFEDAAIDVSHQGTTQPYSTVIGVEDRPGDGIVIITAQGGSELDQQVDTSFDVIETHTAAQQVVENNTTYGTDIPTPSTSTTDGVLVLDRQSGVTSADLVPPADDSPVYVRDDGAVTLHQSLFFYGNPNTISLADPGDTISFTFDLEYSIPAGRVGAGFNTDIQTDSVGVEMKVDGAVVGEIQPGEDFGSSPSWVTKSGSDVRLAPGTHEAVFEVTQSVDSAGDDLKAPNPSGMAVYDTRYDYDFDPQLVDGPQLYPDLEYAEFREPLVTRAVTGIRFRGYYVDNEPGAPILSNGVTTFSGPFQNDVDHDFPGRGPVVDLEVALTRYGQDTNQTPESGFKPTVLTGFRLFADLETMPLVVGESFEGTVADVLSALADTLRGDFVWAYDTDSNGNSIIRFVRSGSRSTTENTLEDYRVRKQTHRVVDQVTVRGGEVRVDNEGVRVQHGTAVSIDKDRLVRGSETVTDPDTGTVYERDVDYTIDYDAGSITAVASPSRSDGISDASVVRVSYEFQPSATVEVDSPTSPRRSETVDILALRSDSACQLAAQQLLDALTTPSYDADATVRGNTTYSVVTDLVASRLPAGISLETVAIEATDRKTTVRLDASQSLGDAVAELRDRIQSVAEHTR